MSRFQKLYVSGCLVSAILGLSGCQSTRASNGPDDRPKVLRYAFTTTSEDPAASAERLIRIKTYLEKELRIEVEVLKTSNSYSAVIEALRANKVDLASISPFAYVMATQTVPIEAIAMRGTEKGEPGEYTGMLAVPSDSPIHSIDDLKKHSKELTISFVDPASASGYMVQEAFFHSIGIDPQRDFKRVVFSMSHPASMMTLKSHKVDVAALAERLIEKYVETGKLSREDYRVLWTSPDIPNQPWAVRKNLPVAFKKEIQRVFLDMPQKDPETFRTIYTRAYTMPPASTFVAATDQMFDPLRKMMRGIANSGVER